MHLDVPLPVRAFEGRDGGSGWLELLGKGIGQPLCRSLVADQPGQDGISGEFIDLGHLTGGHVALSP